MRRENRTLSEVIRLVSSPLELAPMLQGVVDLATDATDCHACFIYLVEDQELVMRAASPVFGGVVDMIRFPLGDGLTGWVARNRRPQFIRERAMDDPRMRYVPELREEDFQSMAAVPVCARAGEAIGVIVLHTQAPHEFAEGTLELLIQIASLVSGAIENAQLYDAERRRTRALAGLSELTQQVAEASGVSELAAALVHGVARLLDAGVCQLLRLDADGEGMELLASAPDDLPAPAAASASELALAGLRRTGGRLWPELTVSDLIVTPLDAGRRIGMLCVAACDGSAFDGHDAEIIRALAHLAAVAMQRAELIADLTEANTIKDLFDALAAGAVEIAAAKAAAVRCDLSAPYVVINAVPAQHASGDAWPVAAEELGRAIAGLGRRCAIEVGPGPLRAVLPLGSRILDDDLRHRCRELGRQGSTVIGISDPRASPGHAGVAYQEARDATTVARALMREGGAIAYSEVGAYRYLVRIAPDEAPRDRMRVVVDQLIEYDRRRRSSLLDTLDRYLSAGQSVLDASQELFIHPNTLRQRLGRMQELTGLDIERDDLLSLQLAIKLARLHGLGTEG